MRDGSPFLAEIGRFEVPYCFDVRFRTQRPIVADKLEEVFNAAPFKRPLRFYRPDGMNRHDGWLAVQSCGYADFWRSRSRLHLIYLVAPLVRLACTERSGCACSESEWPSLTVATMAAPGTFATGRGHAAFV